MATSLFFMAEDEEMTRFSSGKIRPEPGKNTNSGGSSGRGRKQKSKGQSKQDKQPRRGMGVARLESLREQQEMLTKLAAPSLLPVPDPVTGTASATLSASAAANCSGRTAIMGTGNCRVCGYLCCGVGSGRVMIEPGLVVSRELSSIPKSSQQCLYDRCDVCFKKRGYGDGTKSNGGENDKYLTMAPTNGYDLPTFNRDIRKSSSGYEKDFTVTAAINAHNHSSPHYLNEVLDYYMRRNPRNGGGGGGGGGMMLKEYEFFPIGKELQSTNSNETGASGVTAATQSSPTTASTSAIDLSLKL